MHAGVSEAVVVARGWDREEPGRRSARARAAGAGEKRLVAYVVSKDEALEVSEVRAQLKERLPPYMVPSVIVRMAALPRTASGKVDRRSLPEPDGRPELSGYVEPRTEMEQSLAAIWREVLRLDRVGVHDNFFELGGDSIQSIRIVARATQAGLRLTVRQMFEHQTIAALAQVAEQVSGVLAEQSQVVGQYGLTPIQHWYLDEDPVEAHHFNQAFLFKPSRVLQEERLRQALGEVLKHHDQLRARFYREAGGWRQEGVRWEGEVAFETVDLRGLERAQQVSASAGVGAGAAGEPGPG